VALFFASGRRGDSCDFLFSQSENLNPDYAFEEIAPTFRSGTNNNQNKGL
jgi:hypothetical protein